MLESRLDARRAVHEPYPDVQHLGSEVSVGEPPPPERSSAVRLDVHRDPTDERLQPNGRLDRARERPGGAIRYRDAEILVKHAAELDAGLEEERLPTREARGATGIGCRHGFAGAFAGSRGTVNGPRR